jgi:FixJ family two-component response regulator
MQKRSSPEFSDALSTPHRKPVSLRNETGQTVFIVDDDEAVRDSLRLLLHSVGLAVETYDSAAAFLAAYDSERCGCLVLDVRMPGMSGLDLAETLRDRQAILPIIFITGHGDVPMAVQAMQLGAMNFIQKPFRDQELLDLITAALQQDAASRKVMDEQQTVRRRLATLTPRECQVLDLLLEGQINKVIAAGLGVSQRTVEIHRSRIMEKMQTHSLAELVRLVLKVRPE